MTVPQVCVSSGVVHWTVQFRDGNGWQITMDEILVVLLDEPGRWSSIGSNEMEAQP